MADVNVLEEKLAEVLGLAQAAQFSWERTTRETIAVYERVTGKQIRS